jgi:hypothetical protein
MVVKLRKHGVLSNLNNSITSWPDLSNYSKSVAKYH